MPYAIENGYPIFTGLDGLPLDEGYIFIGEVGLNPITNPQAVFWDEALSIPATNIRTRGGYPMYKGSPGGIFSEGEYSLLVRDKHHQDVYFQPDGKALEIGPSNIDLSGLANGYLPVGFAAPNNGYVFPGFVEPGTENLSNTLYPEFAALVDSLDFLTDNGNGTFNVKPTGLDTGWVFNSSWQGQTFTILHNIGKHLSYLDISFEVSSLGTDATAVRPVDTSFDAASSTDSIEGLSLYGDSVDQFLIKTGDNGIDIINTDGSKLTLTTQSWYYRVVVKRKDMPFPAQIKAQVLENGDALTTLMNETGWTANSAWTNAKLTFIHNLNILNPFVVLWISTDGTYENGFSIALSTAPTDAEGLSLYIRDENTVVLQTGANGIPVTEDGITLNSSGSGVPIAIAAQSWYYNIIVYKPQLITNLTSNEEDVIVMTTPLSSYTLPGTASIGDSVEISTTQAAAGVRLAQPSNNTIVRGLSDRTVTGVTGSLFTRPNQALKLTKIGNVQMYSGVFSKIADPVSLPTFTGEAVAWSADGRYLTVIQRTLPIIVVYDWSTGIPVRLADPAILPSPSANGAFAAWSPDSLYLAIATSGITPYVVIYNWSSGSPVKIADPASLPAGDAFGVAWSPSGRYLAVAHDVSPYITIYDFTSGVPVKISNPASLPAGASTKVSWSPDGRYLVDTHVSSPFVTIYDWSSGSPVKIADPASLPAGLGRCSEWSPDGRYLAVGHDNSPYITIYDWSTGVPIKVPDPSVLPVTTVISVAWSPDGRYMSVSHVSTPYVEIYDWVSGVPVRLSNPSTLPVGGGRGVEWSPTGRYLAVAHSNTPYVTVYDCTEAVPGAWQVSLLDGPEIRPEDFRNVTP